MSSGRLRVLGQLTLLTAACLGVGYATMKAVVPTPDETYAALAPDLRRKVDAHRAARRAQEAAAQRAPELTDADAQKPVWAERR